MADKRKTPRKFDEAFKKLIVKLYEGGKSFIYLCIILDLFSRKVIAWSTSQNIDIALVITTTEKED